MYRMRLGFLAGVALLAGCAGPGVYQPPVEDRSGSAPPPRVERGTGVTVTPVYDEPVISRQRLEGDAGLSVQPLSPPDDSPASIPTPEAAAPASNNPAVVALLDSARQQQASGSLGAAQSSLERAQRIAPRDPQVYYQLAELQRQMQKYDEAEQLARRGVAVAGGQPDALRRLWLLIANIRKDAGDLNGARDALEQARRY
ncbi:MAG: tetratricopeptide repeat protein [Oceanospirillaceae bacterium]|nr:tetratricopeptide repeat protein [Oceanospirillaceae bacterium]